MAGQTSLSVRKQVIQSRSGLEEAISGLSAMIDPDMPGPLLYPEPEFTWGSENTVFWDSDSVQILADSMDAVLLAFEIEASFQTTVLWGFVDADVDSARFHSLPEGVSINYRLRYYARTSTGQYRMSHWSPAERSIQDRQAPVLKSWDIPDLQQTQRLGWIVNNTVWNHIVASDSVYGKVMQIAIREERDGLSQITFYDIEIPCVAVDTLVPYPLLAPPNTILNLSVWVIDVAGKASADTLHHTLYWWPYDQDKSRVICYPNPFCPGQGEISIIKVNAPDVTRARIFDPLGNLVAELDKPASRLFFEWNGLNQSGHPAARGGYVLVIDGQQDMYCKIAVY